MRTILASLLLGAACLSARADPIAPTTSQPGLLCQQAIESAGRAHAIPNGLMAAIGQVESGRHDPTSGALHPWPWTVDAEGQGTFYDSKPQAIAAVHGLQARGVHSIDVGCMQVNLQQHPDAFNSLEQAFDPMANADYAARFLVALHGQTAAWPAATAMYHSATPQLGAAYEQKVMAAWPDALRMASTAPQIAMAQGWGGTMTPSLFPPPPRRTAGVMILPKLGAAGGTAAPGRGLDAYRASPIRFGWRRPGA